MKLLQVVIFFRQLKVFVCVWVCRWVRWSSDVISWQYGRGASCCIKNWVSLLFFGVSRARYDKSQIEAVSLTFLRTASTDVAHFSSYFSYLCLLSPHHSLLLPIRALLSLNHQTVCSSICFRSFPSLLVFTPPLCFCNSHQQKMTRTFIIVWTPL